MNAGVINPYGLWACLDDKNSPSPNTDSQTHTHPHDSKGILPKRTSGSTALPPVDLNSLGSLLSLGCLRSVVAVKCIILFLLCRSFTDTSLCWKFVYFKSTGFVSEFGGERNWFHRDRGCSAVSDFPCPDRTWLCMHEASCLFRCHGTLWMLSLLDQELGWAWTSLWWLSH